MSGPTKKLWGGRFQGELDPFFAAVNRSLQVDRRLVAEDLVGSAAWATALGRAAVLTDDEVDTILTALQDLTTDLEPLLDAQPDDEDIHSFVERLLTERIGPLAKKLHTGRSRNDQVATDLKLHLKSMIGLLLEESASLQEILVELADEACDVAIPGYTHLQRAQPITVGHWALAYVEMIHRDRDRLLDAAVRMDTCPLGSAALAGTAFPVDRETIAEDLGFEGGPTRNSLDAVSDRDHACELAFACSLIMVHLSRLAEDTIFFCSQEAGFAKFGDKVSTGSSLMPQKRNPDAMELVRGKTGRVCGDLQALMMMLKGLPLAYDKDLQEDKEALFDAIDTTVACLRITTTAIGDLRFFGEACERAAATGFLDATDLADLLVGAGVPFRDAHDRVGAAVNRATELGVELRDLPASERAELLPEIEGDLDELLSVTAVLNRRDVLGGTAPERVRAEVAWWRQNLEAEMSDDDDDPEHDQP